RNQLRLPDVAYAIVYDADGRIIHDGSSDIATYGQPMIDPLAYEVLLANDLHVQSDADLIDISTPIRIGDQRLGGLRVGYSLASVKVDENLIGATLGERLAEVGRKHLLWIGIMLSVIAAMIAILALYLQHALVKPIRRLATAARQIESGDFQARVPQTGRNDEIGDL